MVAPAIHTDHLVEPIHDAAVRAEEIPELIRVAAPIYLKFGLRNSPDIYPCGTHIENTALALSRERVRRAEIAMETIRRYCPDAVMSPITRTQPSRPHPRASA